MTHDGEMIVSKSEVKIPGIEFNAANDMLLYVSSMASRVDMAFKNLQPFIKHASIPQRKVIIIRSKIESIALYGSVLMFKESESIQ